MEKGYGKNKVEIKWPEEGQIHFEVDGLEDLAMRLLERSIKRKYMRLRCVKIFTVWWLKGAECGGTCESKRFVRMGGETGRDFLVGC